MVSAPQPCLSTPISYTMQEFLRFGHKYGPNDTFLHCACAKHLYFYFRSQIRVVFWSVLNFSWQFSYFLGIFQVFWAVLNFSWSFSQVVFKFSVQFSGQFSIILVSFLGNSHVSWAAFWAVLEFSEQITGQFSISGQFYGQFLNFLGRFMDSQFFRPSFERLGCGNRTNRS